MFDAAPVQRKPAVVTKPSKRCVILKMGSTMPHLAARRGDYEDWIAEGLGSGVQSSVFDAQVDGPLPDPEHIEAVVVTGSSSLVTDREPWSERAGRWLGEVSRRSLPMLAICYGHQLLADVLGGEVGPNRHGREIGQIEVTLNEEGRSDPLFSALPSTLRVSSSHRQSVLRLPAGARTLASNDANQHQAYAMGDRTWGVQFHPEWDHDVIRAYLEARVDILRDEGLDPDALLANVAPSDHGVTLLRRFSDAI